VKTSLPRAAFSLLTTGAVLALSACAGMPGNMPYMQDQLPAAVQVPSGHRVAMETVGSGEIAYECKAKAAMAGEFEWVFVGPQAMLKDRMGTTVGKYYGPPASWEAMDGSKITGMQLAVAPAGTGNIPLQLVKANPAMSGMGGMSGKDGMGAMAGVSHIQRVATQGGVAPAAACNASSAGQKQMVSYRADYIFWKPAM
jgi:hypothetical protein